jgi:hypothetical protein
MADRLNVHAVYADDEGTVYPSATTEALVAGAHRAGGRFWPTLTVPPPRSRVARAPRLLCVREPRDRYDGHRYRPTTLYLLPQPTALEPLLPTFRTIQDGPPSTLCRRSARLTKIEAPATFRNGATNQCRLLANAAERALW